MTPLSKIQVKMDCIIITLNLRYNFNKFNAFYKCFSSKHSSLKSLIIKFITIYSLLIFKKKKQNSEFRNG